MENDKIVVVGGGIAGVFSALLYSSKGYKVTLVEKEHEIGGLLRSQELFESGLKYDFGTHILSTTNISEIDSLLFDGLEVNNYKYLKVGSFYKSLFKKNGFLSDENVEKKDEYLKLLIDSNLKDSYINLKEQLEHVFGMGYAKNVLFPIIEKFFFTNPDQLVENSHALFGLSRIIATTSKETKRLKTKKRFDDALAFHTYKEGLSSRKSIYPIKGGVGNWISFLKNKMLESGVEIITGANIGNIETEKNRVSSISINNKKYYLDKIVWTIPPFFFLNKVGIQLKSKPPKRLTSCIFHFLVDEKYLTDLFYFQCFDPSFKTFRVTLYDNYSEGISGKFRITVEVLLEKPPEDIESLQEEIFNELIRMAILPSKTKLLNKAYNIYPNGFPVLTNEFIENSTNQINVLKANFKNVEVFGKNNGKTWFMIDIVKDIYASVK
jgi:protoporphyrinogen oxidase